MWEWRTTSSRFAAWCRSRSGWCRTCRLGWSATEPQRAAAARASRRERARQRRAKRITAQLRVPALRPRDDRLADLYSRPDDPRTAAMTSAVLCPFELDAGVPIAAGRSSARVAPQSAVRGLRRAHRYVVNSLVLTARCRVAPSRQCPRAAPIPARTATSTPKSP